MNIAALGRLAGLAAFGTLVLTAAVQARQDEAIIGQITRLQAEAAIVGPDGRTTLAAGAAIRLHDRIVTGEGARVEVTLNDGTRLVLGARTRADLAAYAPAAPAVRMKFAIDGAFRLDTAGTPRIGVALPQGLVETDGADMVAAPVTGGYGIGIFEGALVAGNASGRVLLAASKTTGFSGGGTSPRTTTTTSPRTTPTTTPRTQTKGPAPTPKTIRSSIDPIGTTFGPMDAAPSPATTWKAGKTTEALAAVSFDGEH